VTVRKKRYLPLTASLYRGRGRKKRDGHAFASSDECRKKKKSESNQVFVQQKKQSTPALKLRSERQKGGKNQL